jgi:hypothetical protein
MRRILVDVREKHRVLSLLFHSEEAKREISRGVKR